MAMHCARTRRPDARYFKDNQHVQLKISQMHMLTEALRSFVMRVAGEGDAKIGNHPVNNVLLMNFATDTVQKVTALNLEVHGARGGAMPARAEKLVRDALIWTHLAGDSVQRMKAVRRMKWN
jgi:alkylation response protein AidB-like acyl-CoA dehydrogenase